MENKLNKDLGFWDVFCFSAGAMISSGIFILPGLAYKLSGPLVFISYLLAGCLALLGTLSIIELSTAMPKAGGDYFFITRSLGPLAGTLSSLMSWMALCLKSAFAVFGIAEVLYLYFGLPIMLSAFGLCCFFVGLNIYGVKESARLEVILVLGLLGIMFFLVVTGVGKISPAHFQPALPFGINPVVVTAGFVFISFGGLLNIASIAEEVKNPAVNIPRGIICSVGVVSLLYALILIVTVGVLPGPTLASSLTPIADVGRVALGPAGYHLMTFAAILAFITTANAGILSASRYPLALSEDKLFPKFIGFLLKGKKTPYVSIIVTGIFIYTSLTLDLETLVKLGSIVILTLYVLSNIAVILLREGRIQNYRPTFRVPLYPWTNILAVGFFLFLLFDLGLVAVEISTAIIFASVLIYVFYGRKRHQIEFALMHVLERVVNKKLTNCVLEEELKKVVLNRDEIKVDRIHMLFDEALVCDVKKSLSLDAFFELLAKKISADIDLPESEVVALLNNREQEGTTAITPFVAIPHIVIPGINKFKLVIVRCAGGIVFNEQSPAVKAIFVLFGSKDERAFHLKVLASIAQIVQNRNFEKLWLEAKNENNLKDFLLLSERKRH